MQRSPRPLVKPLKHRDHSVGHRNEQAADRGSAITFNFKNELPGPGRGQGPPGFSPPAAGPRRRNQALEKIES